MLQMAFALRASTIAQHDTRRALLEYRRFSYSGYLSYPICKHLHICIFTHLHIVIPKNTEDLVIPVIRVIQIMALFR
jgi:hypothetical protein